MCKHKRDRDGKKQRGLRVVYADLKDEIKAEVFLLAAGWSKTLVQLGKGRVRGCKYHLHGHLNFLERQEKVLQVKE